MQVLINLDSFIEICLWLVVIMIRKKKQLFFLISCFHKSRYLEIVFHHCMHMRMCVAERHKQAANYWGLWAGTNKGRGWFIFPRMVSDSQFSKGEEGRRTVLLSPFSFFLGKGKENVRESDHTSYECKPIFPPSLPLFFSLCLSMCLQSLTHEQKGPSWETVSFPRRG